MPSGNRGGSGQNRTRAEMNLRTHRLTVFASLLIIVPLGFVSKLYNGPGAWWFNNYAGGVLYEIFWCLMIALLWPGVPSLLTAVCVFLVTCFLEFLQLWNPRFLQMVRATFIGRTLIGTTFSWWDSPYYLTGCLAGWLWVDFLGKTRIQGKGKISRG